MSLNQFSQKLVGETLQTGRFGILVDYPPRDGVSSVKDLEENPATARFKPYRAESIINHKMGQVGSKNILTLVVLHERVEDPQNTDLFECPLVDHYRVLEIDKDGRYCQTVYARDNDTNGNAFLLIEGPLYPTQADGSFFQEIPFQFFGSENNDCEYDPVPLYDLAVVNLGHYRNSADYEESIFICGQPMGVWSIAGSQEQFEAANPGGILWGARRGVNVGENGHGTLLQANPNQLADEAMKRKEAQASALGARLITPPHGGRETAEGARIRYGAQNSALYTLIQNISLGIIQCLQWTCQFMGANYDKVKYKLNDSFYDDATDPQMLMAMMQGYDRGFILAQEVRAYMRETGAQAYFDSNDARALKNLHLMSPLEGLDADSTNTTAIANEKLITPSLTPADQSAKPVGTAGGG